MTSCKAASGVGPVAAANDREPTTSAEIATVKNAATEQSPSHLRRADFAVLPVDLDTCRELVAAFHYAQGGSNTGVFTHGLFHREDYMRCLGVAWWLPPTKAAALATWQQNWQGVLSLSRLVIDPDVPTNGASYLLGRSIRLVRRDQRWECLVTYADTGQGHTGAIYRATNWTYAGLTKAEPTWVDQAGRMVARKAGGRTRTKAEMLALGYRCVGWSQKHKYVMPLIPEQRQEATA